jgi:1-acyl-sn-glycerol-3-phosphate acyltransferase
LSLAYSGVRAVVAPIVRALWTSTVTGMHHVPATGPVILAANHLSVADHLFLPAFCPRKVYFMAKAEYFRDRGLKGRVRGAFMSAVGQIPVERGGGRAALDGLERARAVLDAGDVFGIFPEGTRSPDGRLHRGKTGVARLALMTGAPIVPVGIIGTDRVQPIRAPYPRRGHPVAIHVGEPLVLPRIAGESFDRQRLREITDEIMARIQKLSGQETGERPAAL